MPGYSRRSTPSESSTFFRGAIAIPAWLLAQRIGARNPMTRYTGIGGNVPQSLVYQACLDIQAGRPTSR